MGTENASPHSKGLDKMLPKEALATLLAGQRDALSCVEKSLHNIAAGARLMAGAVRAGGKLGYVAAGSSGLMAMADGLELPGTFSIPNNRIKILFAGGTDSLSDMLGGTEDVEEAGISDIHAADLGAGDCIIAVSASGSTPYTVSAARAAKDRGAQVIAIVNNADCPMLADADVGIALLTPPEIIAGSTRMGAGTAQKVAMNMMSTMMAIELGHVHDGYMVNVRADNKKLKLRARAMVSEIGECGLDEAASYLEDAGGSVKSAVLLAAGVESSILADELLAANGSSLRRALAAHENHP